MKRFNQKEAQAARAMLTLQGIQLVATGRGGYPLGLILLIEIDGREFSLCEDAITLPGGARRRHVRRKVTRAILAAQRGVMTLQFRQAARKVWENEETLDRVLQVLPTIADALPTLHADWCRLWKNPR